MYLFSTFPEKAKLLPKVTVTPFSWQHWWAIFFLGFAHFTYNVKYTGPESFHHVLSDVCSTHRDPSLLLGMLFVCACPELFFGQWPQGKVASEITLLSGYLNFFPMCPGHFLSSCQLFIALKKKFYIFIKHLYFSGGRAGPLFLEVTQDSSLCLMSSVQQAQQREVPSALLLKQTPAPPTAL